MRPSTSSPTLFSLLAILFSSTHFTTAKPYPRDVPFGEIANALLDKRQCAYPCGYSGQLCCTSAGQCYTDSSGQAQCGAGSGSGGGSGAAGFSAPVANNQAGGQWAYYTTTYVETGFVTRVSTYSSYLGIQTLVAATTTHAPAVTSQALTCQSGNMPCGGICCASGQYCLSAGNCAAGGAGDVSASYYSSYLSSQTLAPAAPLRPTSGGPTTLTSTASATVPFQTPVGTAGGIVYGAGANVTAGAPAQNAGLSGGAIAGIVIGVLLALLLLVLACCFGGLRRLFGGSRTKKTEETYIHESHHSGTGPPARRQWFGTAKPARPAKKKTGGGAGAVAAGLAGLAIALGLKRRHDRKKASEYSDSGSSYGSSYYDTSSSSESSDRRTRGTRHSRR
ncbi:MAG: hypothetical protein M1817_006899 [Caeruleum heppii]|nr:MAG: hypothetical protein M1817_006899 [Caeruleum heppii]